MTNHSSIFALRTVNSMKRQKDRTLKDELPRLVAAQYATGEEWRNNSIKNEEMEPKQKQHPAVDMTGDGSQGSNPGLPHCRCILYQLNHKGTPIEKMWYVRK